MAPSRRAIVRQSHVTKHYNLCSSPLESNPSLPSSKPSCINNDDGLLRVELIIAHEVNLFVTSLSVTDVVLFQEVSKLETLFSTDVNQLRKAGVINDYPRRFLTTGLSGAC